MSLARSERIALVATMTEVGPDAPTLCDGWTARDLAAHLITRERRPDTGPGILIPAFAGYTDKVRRKAAEQPWTELLELVRSGPPIWSPLRPLDSAVNTTEMFVHHEDVRRGAPDWEPRALDPADEAKLWSALRRMAKMAYRKASVTLVLESLTGDRVVAHKAGDREVVLTGAASELLLHAFGRDAVRVETTGDPADVDAVLALERGL
ncbi:TIGR03085 family metal-binding protein [Aldersonia sp. NBC_00410]|uniref:TIGR03085 family metal-binding protein n=1 Tax=Aldersonia sp. NBC_00410 TaxID=2975954 RepID=UPI00225A4E93|nr:TIGR03085 family metal-binding protein [Aldersonia sp. NBC_00410]MCX5045888.1 TIGR03085 family metal-binding protein [Aldersonia sp. NBC_00410]